MDTRIGHPSTAASTTSAPRRRPLTADAHTRCGNSHSPPVPTASDPEPSFAGAPHLHRLVHRLPEHRLGEAGEALAVAVAARLEAGVLRVHLPQVPQVKRAWHALERGGRGVARGELAQVGGELEADHGHLGGLQRGGERGA